MVELKNHLNKLILLTTQVCLVFYTFLIVYLYLFNVTVDLSIDESFILNELIIPGSFYSFFK